MSEIATLKYEDLTLEAAGFQNPRTSVDGSLINELADSIALHGLLYPLVVWKAKGEDGTTANVVVDGGRRLRAIGKLIEAKKAKGLDKAIPIRLVEAADLKGARIKALTGNIQRVELDSFEVAREVAALKAEGLPQKVLAKQIGKSEAWVSRLLSAYVGASPAVLDAWKRGLIPDDDVQGIVKKHKHEEQDALLDKNLKLRAKKDGQTQKAANAEARRSVKEANGKAGDRVQRPTPEMLQRYIAFAGKPTKAQRYVAGLIDGLRLAIGDIADSELDEEWLVHAASFYTRTDKKAKED